MEFRMSLLAMAILGTLATILVLEHRITILEKGIDAAIASVVQR